MSKIKDLALDTMETLIEVFGEPSVQDRVDEWNRIAGKSAPLKGSDEWFEVIKKQAERILEESKELIEEGVANKDLKEILDAAVDIDYTLKGLVGMLQMPFDMAVESVCNNNDLKFLKSHEEALATLRWYENSGEHCYIHTDPITNLYVIKRVSDDKVMKPLGHPKVDLTEFV